VNTAVVAGKLGKKSLWSALRFDPVWRRGRGRPHDHDLEELFGGSSPVSPATLETHRLARLPSLVEPPVDDDLHALLSLEGALKRILQVSVRPAKNHVHPAASFFRGQGCAEDGQDKSRSEPH
jgi:hypothetical protein